MYQTYSRRSQTSLTPARIRQLRTLLEDQSLDGFIVPHDDEFQNEYLPACNERLMWLTGFTGSAGLAIILARKAAIFIDGRYTLQVKKEVDLSLFTTLQVPKNKPVKWLAEQVGGAAKIGYDPRLHTIKGLENWRTGLRKENPDCELVPVKTNLIDKIWSDRPAPPLSPVSLHPLKYAGRKAELKIADLQKQMGEKKRDALLLTSPVSINWLLNIRGLDVPHTPLALCYAIVHAEQKPELIIEPQKLSVKTHAKLAEIADIHPMSELKNRLAALKKQATGIAMDPARTPCWFHDQLKGRKTKIVFQADPCELPKAIKNAAEIRGMRTAHIRDGVAVCRFLCWLEGTKGKGVSEISAAQKLEGLRADSGKLLDISFETISGAGPNGAIVHYCVDEKSNSPLVQNSLYLVDSGGQYLDGTTDITRTLAIGKPTSDMRRHYTLVLKGHIAIASARFPKGTRGIDLDVLARSALWQAGLDYDHGTGHGVGAYLGVHEGPQGLSRRAMAVLEAGMILSNEPGYYKADHYGIRIENLLLVSKPRTPVGGERPMLGFDSLTQVPMSRALIDKSLLNGAEIDWLNTYHNDVFSLVAPHLQVKKERQWLKQATAAL